MGSPNPDGEGELGLPNASMHWPGSPEKVTRSYNMVTSLICWVTTTDIFHC